MNERWSASDPSQNETRDELVLESSLQLQLRLVQLGQAEQSRTVESNCHAEFEHRSEDVLDALVDVFVHSHAERAACKQINSTHLKIRVERVTKSQNISRTRSDFYLQ